MNCGSESTLSDHCPKGHKAPPLLLLHERPPSGFIQATSFGVNDSFHAVSHNCQKCLCVWFSRECFWCQKKPPPEVHPLLSATWNYSASNLFLLTVPVWSTCGELHNSNWSRNHYFKSKHLPSSAFHCYCLQRAELFWFYSQNVVSKNR